LLDISGQWFLGFLMFKKPLLKDKDQGYADGYGAIGKIKNRPEKDEFL